MDDSIEKARRNLVVVSAAVILAAWLELPPGDLLKRLFGGEAAGNIPASSIWIAVLAVLIYLSLRWHFSTKPPWYQSLASEAKEARTRHSEARVRAEAAQRLLISTGRNDEVFGDGPTLVKRVLSEYSTTVGKPVIHIDRVNFTNGTWQGHARFHVSWPDGYKAEGDEPLRFSLTRSLRRRMWAKSWCVTVVYSKASLESLAPAVLAAVALAILVFKLAAALF